MKKSVLATVAAVLMGLACSFSAFGGTWIGSYEAGWRYVNDDQSAPRNEWKNIDGKDYYFGDDGILYVNTVTPDGYTVGADGAWLPEVSRKGTQSPDMESLLFYRAFYDADYVKEYNYQELQAKTATVNSIGSSVGILIKDNLYTTRNEYFDRNGNPYRINNGRMVDYREKQVLLRLPVSNGVIGDPEVLYTWDVEPDHILYVSINHAAQGKLCISTTLRSREAMASSTNRYYQYDIFRGQIRETSYDENNAMVVNGTYDSRDHLYYTVIKESSKSLSGTIVARNYKNEIVNRAEFQVNIPEMSGSGKAYTSPKYSRIENGEVVMSMTVLSGVDGIDLSKLFVFNNDWSSLPAGIKWTEYEIFFDKTSGRYIRHTAK